MTLQLTVPKMACSACSDAIAKAIKAVSALRNSERTAPTATVQANPKTTQVNVETQAAETEIKQVLLLYLKEPMITAQMMEG